MAVALRPPNAGLQSFAKERRIHNFQDAVEQHRRDGDLGAALVALHLAVHSPWIGSSSVHATGKDPETVLPRLAMKPPHAGFLATKFDALPIALRAVRTGFCVDGRSEERRVGKEC